MKRAAIIALVLAAVLAGGGCLFEPREALPPFDEGEGDWITPKTPKDVFLNLTTGLAAAGNSNYERSLAETFTFILTQACSHPTLCRASQLGAGDFTG